MTKALSKEVHEEKFDAGYGKNEPPKQYLLYPYSEVYGLEITHKKISITCQLIFSNKHIPVGGAFNDNLELKQLS